MTRCTPLCWGLRLIFFWNQAEFDWMILPEEAMFDLLSLLSVASLNFYGALQHTHNNNHAGLITITTLLDNCADNDAIEPIRTCLLLYIIIMSGTWGVFFGYKTAAATGESSASVGRVKRHNRLTALTALPTESYSTRSVCR